MESKKAENTPFIFEVAEGKQGDSRQNGNTVSDKAAPANHWKMYMAALIACIGSMSLGAAMGYSSPALISMAKNNSGFVPLDEDERTWVGSIMTIGALLGGFAAGPFIDRFGRRTLLIATVVPFTAGWIIVAFSGKFALMLVGRLVTGFCSGVMSLGAPVYVSETTNASIRGFFGSCSQLAAFTGVLIAYSMGIVVDWKYLAFILAIFPVLVAVGMFFMPESPRFLLGKDRRDDAIKAIIFLNGPACDPDAICKEMEDAIAEQPSGQVSLKEATSMAVIKPLVLSLLLMVFQQWCGFNGVLFYAGNIFTESGFTSIDPLVSSIILGAAQWLGTFVSLFLIDRSGRRVLLIISGIVMSVGLTALSIYYILLEKQGDEISLNYGWITVASLSLYCFAFAVGYGPIAWLMMGELLPVRVRGPASSLSTAFNWTNAFLVTKTFETMKHSMTDYGAFFFYDAICIISCVFVVMFLPETKGKSLEDIERFFAPKGKKSSGQNGLSQEKEP